MSAVEELRRRLEEDPKDRKARVQLAELLTLGADGRAKALREAVALDPYSIEARRELALAVHREGDFQGAHEAYLEALRLAPDDAELLAHHGLLALEGLSQQKRRREDLLELAGERFVAAMEAGDQGPLVQLGLIDCALAGFANSRTPLSISELFLQLPVELGLARALASRFLSWSLWQFSLDAEKLPVILELAHALQERWKALLHCSRALAWLSVVPEVLEASTDQLAELFQVWLDQVHRRAPLFLLIRLRLDLAANDVERLGIIEAILARDLDDPFLRREQLRLLHRKAKRALAFGLEDEARKLWKRCRNIDPYNDRILQNLALVSLRRREALKSELLWEELREDWLLKCRLFPANLVYVELLGLEARLRADRLHVALMRGGLAEEEHAEKLSEWLRCGLQSAILRGQAAELPGCGEIVDRLGGLTRRVMRAQLPELLKALHGQLLSPLRASPPFHYELFGLDKGAPPSLTDRHVARRLLQPEAISDPRVQEAAACLTDAEARRAYDEETLGHTEHAIYRDLAATLLRLTELVTKRSTPAIASLTIDYILALDFRHLRVYVDEGEPERYEQVRDQLIRACCDDVVRMRYSEPAAAMERLQELVGDLLRWTDPDDCVVWSRIFNECELLYVNRQHRRSTFNGFAKGMAMLDRARELTDDLGLRARILQQLAEIETQAPQDIIATPMNADPDIKLRLTVALGEIRGRNFEQARMRLESLLRRNPQEVSAMLMIAKINMEEALMAFRVMKDRGFLEEQLNEAKSMLASGLAIPGIPEELVDPCRAMIGRMNELVEKAKRW